MSKSFDSGVSSYVHGRATVDIFFPVDGRGNADISCSQCFFFREASRRCGLNGEVVPWATKFVGVSCPLEIVDEEENKEE